MEMSFAEAHCFVELKATDITLINLRKSVLEPEIEIDNYKILRCNRNRHGGGVAVYTRMT